MPRSRTDPRIQDTVTTLVTRRTGAVRQLGRRTALHLRGCDFLLDPRNVTLHRTADPDQCREELTGKLGIVAIGRKPIDTIHLPPDQRNPPRYMVLGLGKLKFKVLD